MAGLPVAKAGGSGAALEQMLPGLQGLDDCRIFRLRMGWTQIGALSCPVPLFPANGRESQCERAFHLLFSEGFPIDGQNPSRDFFQ